MPLKSTDASPRREFLKSIGASGISLGAARSVFAAKQGSKTTGGRVIGANDRINIGVIGVGGRGSGVARSFASVGQKDNSCRIVAVSDVYEKRKRAASERFKVPGYLDYRELLTRPDVDAVIIATPDHWHGKMAFDAMDLRKDVYVEKPMVHTNEEARRLVHTAKETGCVLQVGSQTTSADQWWKARKAIQDGAIGQMVMSQGSYHRNSFGGEWTEGYSIDADAGPQAKGDNYIDWNMWLGPATKRAFDADRFFRFRKYWDYSGGIATDLFYHVVAPLQICWGEAQFPQKVTGSGGIYIFKDEREVPDTFHLMAEYPRGHSLVLSSSMANAQHIPGLIRGHSGTITMVDHGVFERATPYITVRPEFARDRSLPRGQDMKPIGGPEYVAKFGDKEFRIAVDPADMMVVHVRDFLRCVRTREKPHLDVETGAKAVVVINLAVQSYRLGRTLYWDEKNWKVSEKPTKS